VDLAALLARPLAALLAQALAERLRPRAALPSQALAERLRSRAALLAQALAELPMVDKLVAAPWQVRLPRAALPDQPERPQRVRPEPLQVALARAAPPVQLARPRQLLAVLARVALPVQLARPRHSPLAHLPLAHLPLAHLPLAHLPLVAALVHLLLALPAKLAHPARARLAWLVPPVPRTPVLLAPHSRFLIDHSQH